MITGSILRHKFISMTILWASRLSYATHKWDFLKKYMLFAEEIAQEGNAGSFRYAANARHFFGNYSVF